MRLELSRRTDLAVRSLRYLAAAEGRVKRPVLAAAIGTSPDFLARVMADLVTEGWVRSEPGRNGGYELAADLRAVSMLQLITATEGAPDESRCVLRGGPCAPGDACGLHEAWSAGRIALLDELDRTPVVR